MKKCLHRNLPVFFQKYLCNFNYQIGLTGSVKILFILC